MAKQCPKCGASNSDVEFIGSFCIDCFMDMNLSRIDFPKEIVIYVCRECSAEKFKSWDDVDLNSSISASLKSKAFGIPSVSIADEKYAIVKYNGINREFKIPIRIKRSICSVCMQKYSGYYEAIVQLRGKYCNDKFINRFIARLEKITFIPKIDKLKEGVDVYAGSRSAVRSLISSLKLKPKLSHKLYGVKNGRRVYRTTFLLKYD